ncbi:hypothetical protein BJY04DRAFT_195367 [Aspergillus karnatakaensis]|uniref:uncharacterized protein n=1 Tax=Aspergillus karnatakaensis TaxID=1810916 RepID=UPI003CCDFCCC
MAPKTQTPTLLPRKEKPLAGPNSSTGFTSRKHQEHRLRRRTKKGNGHAMVDEEEVVYELNEAALAKLPIYLQNNMREIHSETLSRLQAEQRQFLNRRAERANQVRMKESEKHDAEQWFLEAIAELDEARKVQDELKREMEKGEKVLQQKMEEYGLSFGCPQNMTWCPVQRVWVPVSYHGRDRVLGMTSKSGTVGMENIRGYGRSHRMKLEVEADAVHARNGSITRCECHGSSYERYRALRCSGPYYVNEAEPGRGDYQREVPRHSRNGSSLISAARNHIRSKMMRVKEFLKK